MAEGLKKPVFRDSLTIDISKSYKEEAKKVCVLHHYFHSLLIWTNSKIMNSHLNLMMRIHWKERHQKCIQEIH